jgi:hypothetical protein
LRTPAPIRRPPPGCRAYLAGRAVTALQRVALDEGGLQRVQLPVGDFGSGQALDRGDLGALGRHGQQQAAVDPPTVHQDGASPALTVVAAFFGSGQPEMLAQRVEHGCPVV